MYLNLLVKTTLKVGKQEKHDLTREERIQYFDVLGMKDCNILNQKVLQEKVKDFLITYRVISALTH